MAKSQKVKQSKSGSTKQRKKKMNDSKIIKPAREYVVIMPGFQAMVKFDGDMHEFIDYIENQITNTRKIILKPTDAVINIFHVSPEQHFSYSIMTRAAFESYKTQQEMMANMQAGAQIVGLQQ